MLKLVLGSKGEIMVAGRIEEGVASDVIKVRAQALR